MVDVGALISLAKTCDSFPLSHYFISMNRETGEYPSCYINCQRVSFLNFFSMDLLNQSIKENVFPNSKDDEMMTRIDSSSAIKDQKQGILLIDINDERIQVFNILVLALFVCYH